MNRPLRAKLLSMLACAGIDFGTCERLAAVIGRAPEEPSMVMGRTGVVELGWARRRLSAKLSRDMLEVAGPDGVLVGSLDVDEFERMVCPRPALVA